jgi:hypothetical protein
MVRERSGHSRVAAIVATLLLLGGLLPVTALADITVTATVSNNRVRVGETITLSIEASGTQSLEAPAIAGPDGFHIRYLGPSQQVTVVNGAISARIQHRYAVTAQREGSFSIGPFEVSHEGKTYRIEPVTIRVSPASAAPDVAEEAGDATGESLRLTLSVDRPRVYLHERVPVDVTLYVGQVTARDLQYPTLPAEGVSIEGFGQPIRSAQVIDGQRFEVLRFRTSVTPLKSGSLVLGPARTSLNVVSRPQNFFFTQRQPVELASNAVTLEVLPLPVEGRPADYSGAVGTFSLEVGATPAEVDAGDPVTVTITLRGEANLAQLQPPAFRAGEGFKVYDPQVADASGDQVRVYEQVVIPEHAGVTELPALAFSFFDPGSGQYRTARSAPIPLVVRASERDAGRQIVSASGVELRKDPEALGRDIVYIKDDPGVLQRRDDLAMRWWGLLLWQPVPVLLYFAVVWFDRRRRRLSGDERFARATRAGRTARTALDQAEKALAAGNGSSFYDQLENALRAYLSAKLGLPPGAVDGERLRQAGIGEEVVDRAAEILAACEQVRFAPIAGAADQRQLLAQARTIVRDMERNRSLRPA